MRFTKELCKKREREREREINNSAWLISAQSSDKRGYALQNIVYEKPLKIQTNCKSWTTLKQTCILFRQPNMFYRGLITHKVLSLLFLFLIAR